VETTGLTEKADRRRVVLVLQGGGALGAYQAGVYEALAQRGYVPDWVAGTSIGAINGGLIAGNPPAQRVARLREFWELVSEGSFCNVAAAPDAVRELYSLSSAWEAILGGRRGFFSPRPWFTLAALPIGSGETSSYYDTGPLRETLERLVDFQLLNAGPARLTVGAVHVTKGTLRYFDSKQDQLGAEHLLASGALPPGFPAVRIGEDLYWDGGIYSNTPLEVVLDDLPKVDTLCFVLALFNPAGPEPRSIPQVETRLKDITYGTRAREQIQFHRRIQNLQRTIRWLYKLLPDEVAGDPELLPFAREDNQTTMHVVQMIYPTQAWELAYKDVDFSRAAVEERWQLGFRDAVQALDTRPWLRPVDSRTGLVVHTFPLNPETYER